MTPSEMLEQFREEMNDAADPFLWSDDLVAGYIGDAEQTFARKTDGFSDSTTAAVVELPVTPNDDTYTLHPKILKIRGARRGDTGRPIDVINVEDMATRGLYFDGRTGVVKYLVTGMDDGFVRIWPVPNETVTIKLSVFRLPLVTIGASNIDNAVFETPEQHHQGLMLWVKHRAYSKQDAETFDKTKAAEFEQQFYAYCRAAKAEQGRLRHKPRSVVYGGI